MSNKNTNDNLLGKPQKDRVLDQAFPAIVRVALPVPLRKLFDYTIPNKSNVPGAGCRVQVKFANRNLTGLVINVSNTSKLDRKKLKAVEKVLDSEPVLDAQMLKFLSWVTDYYIHPVGEVLFAALPKRLRNGKILELPKELYWVISKQGRQALSKGPGRARVQFELLSLFAEEGQPLGVTSCQPVASSWKNAVKALLDKGHLLNAEPPAAAESVKQAPLEATPDQKTAISSINSELDKFQCFLLHGITGSGKTEIYLRCIAEVLKQNCQALVLVPEISLTPQLVDRFKLRFNAVIDVMHSSMNDTQRVHAWERARQGISSIIIGTRSAVFVPMARPGIIIIDEEHDASFKQQDGFRYHARDVAIKRASMLSVPIVMGSATPSLESWHNAQLGKYKLLSLQQRATAGGLPDIHLLDVDKQPLENGISAALREGIKAVLKAGEQSLVFINRRGFAPAVCCTACNALAQCTRCDARMTWHKKNAQLLCHHCGKQSHWPQRCPQCGETEMVALGQGTENIHETIVRLLPEAHVERIDRDTVRRKGELEQCLQRAHSGETDILVGTQMLSKGHDFPNLSLVGILDCDQLLFSSDFRASERLFQLITQVSGRAGRAEKKGNALVQTRFPDSPWLQAIAAHDYEGFAEMALAERKGADYPPYSFIAVLRAEAIEQQLALSFLSSLQRTAQTLIQQQSSMNGVKLSEPVPSVMEKRAGRYRAQLLVQASDRKPLHVFLNQWRTIIEQDRESRRVRWSLDVDPVDLF